MKKTAAVIVWTTLLMGALIASKAYSTPSTLIWIPSTGIQRPDVVHMDIDMFSTSGRNPATVYGLLFGNGKFEYGLDYLPSDNDAVYLNAKALLIDETPSAPRIALGVYGVGSRSEVSSNIVYLVGSKEFSAGTMTFGYGLGRKKVLGRDRGMVMLGFDRMLDEKWSAAVDYQGGKSVMGALSAGMGCALGGGKSIIVGFDRFNDRSISDILTVQVDMDF